MKTTNKRVGLIVLGAFLINSLGCWSDGAEPLAIEVFRRSFDEGQPQCRLYLQGARPSEVLLETSSLASRYLDGPSRFEVYGSGEFVWHAQTIQITDGVVMINGTKLPPSESRSFIIHQDGSVVEGFISSAR